MLAWEERGNQHLWGHRGLCRGEDEKAILTPQGENCLLARTEGQVERKSKDDPESGIRTPGKNSRKQRLVH